MQTVTQRAVPINAAKLARQGDARALLAIPEARKDIPRLIAGQAAKRTYSYEWRQCLPLATDLGNRKAITEAKKLITEREARREARKAAETARQAEPGKCFRLAKERAAAKLEAQRQAAEPIVAEAFRSLYRVYEHKVRLAFGEPNVRVSTSTKWVSGRGGFGHVTDGQTTHITVRPTWVADVHAKGLDYVDGLMTLDAQPAGRTDGIEVFRAEWIRQGRGYELHAQRGYIARTVGRNATYHSTTSAQAAVTGLKRKLTAQGLDPAEAKAKRDAVAARRAAARAAQLAKLIDRVTRWDLGEITNVVVRRADSIQAGNCVPGTDAFIDRFFPDRGPDATATIGEIAKRAALTNPLSLSGDLLTLARQVAAACLVAIRRDRNARRSLMA